MRCHHVKDEVLALVLHHIGSKEHCGGVAVTCLPGNAWTQPFLIQKHKAKTTDVFHSLWLPTGSLDTSVKNNPCSAEIQSKN